MVLLRNDIEDLAGESFEIENAAVQTAELRVALPKQPVQQASCRNTQTSFGPFAPLEKLPWNSCVGEQTTKCICRLLMMFSMRVKYSKSGQALWSVAG